MFGHSAVFHMIRFGSGFVETAAVRPMASTKRLPHETFSTPLVPHSWGENRGIWGHPRPRQETSCTFSNCRIGGYPPDHRQRGSAPLHALLGTRVEAGFKLALGDTVSVSFPRRRESSSSRRVGRAHRQPLSLIPSAPFPLLGAERRIWGHPRPRQGRVPAPSWDSGFGTWAHIQRAPSLCTSLRGTRRGNPL
jgi:hypothetical protein